MRSRRGEAAYKKSVNKEDKVTWYTAGCCVLHFVSI